MKKCTACAKDLPDTAMHCVFCGAKQAAAPAPAPSANAKTVLGYSAADLLKNLPGGAPPPGGAPRPGAPAPQSFQPPAPAPYQPPQQFQPPAPQSFQPPAPAPYQPPQQFQPPAPAPAPYQPPPQQFQPPAPMPPAQPFGAPQPGFPPPAQGGQFGGAASAATVFMQNAPQIPQAQPQPAPAPFQPQPMQPPMAAPMPFQPPQPAPFQPQPMPMGGGMPMGQPAPQPYNPQPVGAPMGAPGQPPFLASQTAARMDKPVEPYNDVIKLVCLIYGACLLAAFVIPTSFSPLQMMVTSIGDAPGATKLAPILVGLGGVVGILLGVAPGMQALQRGLFAAAVGGVPILLFGTFVMGGFDWHLLVYPIGGILVPAGLLLRDKYPADKLPRLFVFIGAACVVVPFFVPFQAVDMVLDLIKSIAKPSILVHDLGAFIPLVLAAFAVLLCMIPGRAKFGAKQLAWAWFTFPPALAIAELTTNGSIVNVLTKGPGGLFQWAGPSIGAGMAAQAQAAADAAKAAAAAGANAQDALKAAGAGLQAGFGLPLYTGFAAIACFGLCVLFGKQLEQGK